MADIYQYEELYKKLTNGEHITPVSREEAFDITLIESLSELKNELVDSVSGIKNKLDWLSTDGQNRTLKNLLDFTKNTIDLFKSYNTGDAMNVAEYLPEGLLEYADTAKVRMMNNMFENCASLKTVPLFDTSAVNNMAYMFKDCTSLESIPSFDTHNNLCWYGTFSGCSSLEEVPALDFGKNNNSFMGTFAGCTSLKNCWITNIRGYSLTVGSGTNYGHLLTVESLLHLCKELISNSSSSTLTLTIGSANLTKLADVYVKLIEVTDEMIAEDSNIERKKPFEVCESTDEGAMLIIDYVTLKKWKLA